MKIIKFIPWSKVIEETTPRPVRTELPQWWRDGETTFDSPLHPKHAHDEDNHGMKTCIPFMEIMMTGYTILTPFDIYVVKTKDGETSISFNGPTITEEGQAPFISQRPAQLGATIPRPKGFMKPGFTWFTYWSWQVPKGYSTFVTHPFNRHDLPFYTLSAIMDADKFTLGGNIPFFLKEDFEGIIPAGTPFVQIYPFKRDKWKMWVERGGVKNAERLDKIGRPLRTKEGSYKKKFWTRKEFE